MQMYQEDLKLKLEMAENKLIESGILAVNQKMMRGELKVFSSLRKYLEELRYYHRDESGHVVAAGDQLQNAARYLVVSGISQMRQKPVPDEFAGWYRHPILPGTTHGWMG